MIRKATIMFLVFVLMMLGTGSAFATEETATCNDQSTLNFQKLYKELNSGSTSPAESFEFTIEKVSAADSQLTLATMPEFANENFTIDFNKGDATTSGQLKGTTINLPTFENVGVYKYRITEKTGNTAGVVYEPKSVILTITVANCQKTDGDFDRMYTMAYEGDDSTKITNVANTYKAGNLEVSKQVTGLMGDTKKDFTMDVVFKAPADTKVNSEITYVDEGVTKIISANDWNNTQATATIAIKDGETVTFQNIPYGVTYTVTEREANQDGYTTAYTYSDNTNKVIDSASDSVSVQNSKGGNIPTGIVMTMIPAALALIALAGILTAVVMIRRRRYN